MASVFLLGSHGPVLLGFRGVLISDLIAAGHRVYACAPDLEGETAQKVRALGAEPLTLEVDRHDLGPMSNLRYAAALKRLMQRLRPDVFLGYTAKPVVWGAPAARAAGVKTVAALITGLGYAFTEGREVKRKLVKTALSALYRRALARCDAVIFQNPDDRDVFEHLSLTPRGRAGHVVNGSGVDLSHYQPAPIPKKPVFLMIARLLKDKGTREYANAALALKARHPDAAFRLAGWLDPSPDCIDPKALEQWIAGGLEFLGRLDDVRPALANCACYVLPSYREGTPRTVLEAMAMGRGIITTDAPGCRETVVEGENGYRVPVRDAAALETAMERMILNPTLFETFGKGALRLAQSKYEIHAVNRHMMTILGL